MTNDILLSNKDKSQLTSYSFTEMFELFFSNDLKNYIISSTIANGYDLSRDELDIFIGIIIFTIFNRRLSQRDYWSTDQLLGSEVIKAAMSRDKFEKIKSFLKYSMPDDQNDNDKVWRVRKILDIFRVNIRQFGFFATALSIDEMMIKYYGRKCLKQFIKSKPIRFGIKMWAVCSAEGYLFDCDVYCGKNSNTANFLPNCAQGSRVVLQMLQELLKSSPPRTLLSYHIYFDNLFTSPDLLVHMKKLGLRATGTVRSDRVPVKNEIDKKAARGTYIVKHEKNSKMNFITVVDSKPVSFLSTAAGVTPLSTVKRYNKTEKEKTDLQYPNAVISYNKYMGGNDLHDQHCNKLLPIIRSKKWTWVIFLRLIQSSITNATVLYNICNNSDKKVGTKDFALSISRDYLTKSQKKEQGHKLKTSDTRRYCSGGKCAVRSNKFCECCNLYFCVKCFEKTHLS